ncbi:MAG TPA: DUF2851 family protein [Cyclobacteriaceae bacterium]|nr:DUF2851 family protein [Cyclobacteriaceae bacterium]
MTESFLHYIWQFQYFKKDDLKTSEGEVLEIFNPGIRNEHAGPDFSEAKIKIGKLEWRGSVEIHINASGWSDHHHDTDQAYEKVVLHVVWQNDKPLQRTDKSVMPTLELKDRVDLMYWDRYKKLFTSVESIPCSGRWPGVPEITKLAMIERTLLRRLEHKAVAVKAILSNNSNDWDETCYNLLMRNFGFKVNAAPMGQLAEVLPYKILLKHIDKTSQVEALLFGQAGFLGKAADDDYTVVLKREYRLLSSKYNLEERRMNAVQWRFLRMRPANFPTVRLSQVASLLTAQKNLFSKIIECLSYPDLVKLFTVETSTYWQHHYQPGKKSKSIVSSLGKASIENIMINTVAPMLVAYAQFHDEQIFIDRAVEILQHVPSEDNKIVREWSNLGFRVTSAFDSQGLIELYNDFCMKRRCLECAVGTYIIKS